MIYLFFIVLTYLIGLLVFAGYAYEVVDRFDVPYKPTRLEEKCSDLKDRYKLCYMRFSSK